jgi:hypothetical protein
MEAKETTEAMITVTLSLLLVGCSKSLEELIPNPVEDDPHRIVLVHREPVVIKKVAPEYPKVAWEAGIEAYLWFLVLVDEGGSPAKILFDETAEGNWSTPIGNDRNNERINSLEIFVEPCTTALKKFLFIPAIGQDGKPTKVWVRIPIRFKLPN